MATIAENLQTIQTIKDNIKTSIENKGVDVGDVSFTEYSTKIDEITTGGGGGTLETINITENGVYVPSEGVDGYNQVNVNVSGEIMSLISPDTLKMIRQSGINHTNYYFDWDFFYIYDGYCVENPENGEIGVPNYTYNSGNEEWQYVIDANDNNYLTPSNFIIDKYLEDNNVEIQNNSNISLYGTIGSLVTDQDGISTTYLYNIDGSEYEVRYNNDTYSIKNYMYPTDLISGYEYQNFHPVIKPAYVCGDVVDYNTMYQGKRFMGGYFNQCTQCVDDPSKRIYFSDYCIVDDFRLYGSSNQYCPIVAPELKINEIQSSFRFASDVYQKITIENYVYGYETFEKCRGLKELIINNFIRGGNYFIYDCDNLETLHIEDMSALEDVGNYIFLGTSNLKNISGFNNLGMGFIGRQFVRMGDLYNLTKESIINIFNGLYDMNQNPNVQTSTILLAHKYISQLSDEEIAIATNKGWVVSY